MKAIYVASASLLLLLAVQLHTTDAAIFFTLKPGAEKCFSRAVIVGEHVEGTYSFPSFAPVCDIRVTFFFFSC